MSASGSEHNEQSQLFYWIRLKGQTDERFRNIYAVPNVQLFPAGSNRSEVARIVNYLKKEGMEPGCLDINIDWPSNGFHGLRIEIKFGKGRLSPLQKDWKRRLELAGYATDVCYSCEEAKKAINEYFGGKDETI